MMHLTSMLSRPWLGVCALLLSLGAYLGLTLQVLGVSEPHPVFALTWMLASCCGGGVLFLEHTLLAELPLAPKVTAVSALTGTMLAVVGVAAT